MGDLLSCGLNRKGTRKDMETYMRRVPVYNTSTTNAAKVFVEQLQADLKEKCHINTTEVLSFDEVQADEGKISIVIYNKIDSGQVVDKCFKDIDKNHLKRIILIVLHVMREDNLPSESFKKKLQVGKNGTIYREVGRIIDMGFEDGKGIYRCSMNTSAFQEIKQFCSGYEPKAKAINASQQVCTDDEDVAGNIDAALYLMVPSETNATKLFVNALQDKLNGYGVSVIIKSTCDAGNLDPKVSLIVVCNNITRISADIDSTLRDINSSLYSRIILLVLHVGEDPEPKANSRRALGPVKYQDIRMIIDIAFSRLKGLYTCDMNSNVFAILENIHSIRASDTNKQRLEPDDSFETGVDRNCPDCSEISEAELDSQANSLSQGPANEGHVDLSCNKDTGK